MLTFMKSTIDRRPIQCTSLAVDGAGTNLGIVNGVKGRVCVSNKCLSAALHVNAHLHIYTDY